MEVCSLRNPINTTKALNFFNFLKNSHDTSTEATKSKIVNSVEVAPVDAWLSHERIFNENVTETPDVIEKYPKIGAKGFILDLYLSGANNNLSSGEGVRLEITSGAGGDRGLRLVTDYIHQSYNRQTVVWYPGANNDNGALVDSGAFDVYPVSMPLPSTINIRVRVDGEFSGEEYINPVLDLEWLT